MCGKHAIRVRRHGDPHYITPLLTRRLACRHMQPTLGRLQRQTYPKYLGLHTHRFVAQKILGRKLKRGEIVHHKDGNKHNNSPRNLVVMTQSEHMRMHIHQMLKARKRQHGY